MLASLVGASLLAELGAPPVLPQRFTTLVHRVEKGCFCQSNDGCPPEAKWSCPVDANDTAPMSIDYELGARKTVSPMSGVDKNLTYVLRNDKLLNYMIEPFSFAPNDARELCYAFGLDQAQSIGPPFELFANATKTGTVPCGRETCDEWRQHAAFSYPDPLDGVHEVSITTTFTLKRGTNGAAVPHKVDYRYLDLGHRSDYKQNYQLVSGTYTYLTFEQGVTDADFAIPASVHCKLFTDSAAAAQYAHATSRPSAASLAGPLPDPTARTHLLAPINDAVRLAALNARLEADGASWRAGANLNFEGVSVGAHAETLLRRLPVPSWAADPELVSIANFHALLVHPGEALPAAFDARTHWTGCSGAKTISDQGQCGSCFAWAAAQSFQDRLCVASGGATDVVLSKMHILSCDNASSTPPDGGCGGGELDNVWRWITANEMVPETCAPSTHAASGVVDPCRASCKTTYHAKPGSAYSPVTDWQKAAAQIQADILKHGPIEVGLWEFDGLQSYKSGIYSRPKESTQMLGGHAVTLIGWGVANQTDYWIVQNTWGENGYFRIVRGVNAIGIEDQAVSARIAAPASGLVEA